MLIKYNNFLIRKKIINRYRNLYSILFGENIILEYYRRYVDTNFYRINLYFNKTKHKIRIDFNKQRVEYISFIVDKFPYYYYYGLQADKKFKKRINKLKILFSNNIMRKRWEDRRSGKKISCL